MYLALIQNNEEVKENDKNDINFLSESEYLKSNEKMGTITACAGYDAVYKKIEYAITAKKSLPLTASALYCSNWRVCIFAIKRNLSMLGSCWK